MLYKNSRIEVYQAEENGRLSIGIRVHSDDASLADLLEVWQPLCDDTRIFKSYGVNNHSACRGCTNNCCNTAYVIPDLISFKKMAAYLKSDYPSFINRYFQAEKVSRGLLRMVPEPCIFLKERICEIYPVRSLICRFYLCSPLLGDTEQLIYSITWTGITATLLFAQGRGLIPPLTGNGITSFDRLFINLFTEYRSDPKVELFLKAKNYEDIPLKPFIHSL
ncbi:YkgJ family cysteine cluster protein [Syntrophomonas erecta]